MTQREKTVKKAVGIHWSDRLMMAIAYWAVASAAIEGVAEHVRAPHPMNYGLAALGIGFLTYMLFTPLWHKS